MSSSRLFKHLLWPSRLRIYINIFIFHALSWDWIDLSLSVLPPLVSKASSDVARQYYSHNLWSSIFRDLFKKITLKWIIRPVAWLAEVWPGYNIGHTRKYEDGKMWQARQKKTVCCRETSFSLHLLYQRHHSPTLIEIYSNHDVRQPKYKKRLRKRGVETTKPTLHIQKEEMGHFNDVWLIRSTTTSLTSKRPVKKAGSWHLLIRWITIWKELDQLCWVYSFCIT